jgi:hypothetical protein
MKKALLWLLTCFHSYFVQHYLPTQNLFCFLYLSLLSLSQVINALGNPEQRHVPFQDSKLTHLLQSSLSGNAQIAVICCVTPSELYMDETQSTLQFAIRAMSVTTHAQVNECIDDRSLIRRLQNELTEANQLIAMGGAGAQMQSNKALNTQKVSNKDKKQRRAHLSTIALQNGFFFGEHVRRPQFGNRRLSELAQKTPLKNSPASGAATGDGWPLGTGSHR